MRLSAIWLSGWKRLNVEIETKSLANINDVLTSAAHLLAFHTSNSELYKNASSLLEVPDAMSIRPTIHLDMLILGVRGSRQRYSTVNIPRRPLLVPLLKRYNSSVNRPPPVDDKAKVKPESSRPDPQVPLRGECPSLFDERSLASQKRSPKHGRHPQNGTQYQSLSAHWYFSQCNTGNRRERC